MPRLSLLRPLLRILLLPPLKLLVLLRVCHQVAQPQVALRILLLPPCNLLVLLRMCHPLAQPQAARLFTILTTQSVIHRIAEAMKPNRNSIRNEVSKVRLANHTSFCNQLSHLQCFCLFLVVIRTCARFRLSEVFPRAMESCIVRLPTLRQWVCCVCAYISQPNSRCVFATQVFAAFAAYNICQPNCVPLCVCLQIFAAFAAYNLSAK